MAVDQVLATVRAALAAQLPGIVTALAAGDPEVQTDFAFDGWANAAEMKPTNQPRVGVAPASALIEQRRFGGQTRDARHRVRITGEFFGVTESALEKNVAKALTGVTQVLDGLAEYSLANGGTVVTVDPESRGFPVEFGDFGGTETVTSAGFALEADIYERSTL